LVVPSETSRVLLDKRQFAYRLFAGQLGRDFAGLATDEEPEPIPEGPQCVLECERMEREKTLSVSVDACIKQMCR
jgi:hypothetical protein